MALSGVAGQLTLLIWGGIINYLFRMSSLNEYGRIFWQNQHDLTIRQVSENLWITGKLIGSDFRPVGESCDRPYFWNRRSRASLQANFRTQTEGYGHALDQSALRGEGLKWLLSLRRRRNSQTRSGLLTASRWLFPSHQASQKKHGFVGWSLKHLMQATPVVALKAVKCGRETLKHRMPVMDVKVLVREEYYDL